MTDCNRTPFQNALLDAALEEFADIPPEDEIQLEFSPAFSAWAERLVDKSKGKTQHRGHMGIKRAVLIAAILAALTITAMAIEPIRQKIIQFITRDDGLSYTFEFDPEIVAQAPGTIETAYAPTYVPEGYCVSGENYTIAGVSKWYRNGTGDRLLYDQFPIPDDMQDVNGFHVDSEYSQKTVVVIGNYQLMQFNFEDQVILMWMDHQYYYNLEYDKNDIITEEEILKILDGIVVVEDVELIGAD